MPRSTRKGMVRRTARRAYYPANPPARRRSNGVSKSRYEKAEASRKRALKRARDIKEKMGTQAPLVAVGGFVLGSVTAGAIGAAIDTTWMGVDVRLLLAAGLVATAAFADLGDPLYNIGLASMGLGIGAPAIATTVDEALSGVFSAAA